MKTVADIPLYRLDSTDDPLNKIFEWRKELMDAYVQKGKLPPYPLKSLGIAEDQNFLRTVMGYCEEEIFEAFDEIESLAKLAGTNPQKSEFVNILAAFNEELADVNHFIFEILLYLNIDDDDIQAYYMELYKQRNLGAVFASGSVLGVALSYANYCNMQNGYKSAAIMRSQYTLIHDDDTDSVMLQAGRKVSEATLQEHQTILFNVVRNLNSIRGLLKAKYWKDNAGASPNIELVQKFAMEAFLYWMCYLDFVGATEKSITQTYYKKHMVNLDRLENGY